MANSVDAPMIRAPHNVKEGEILGFDGRVISTSIGEDLEKKMSAKKVGLRIDKDLAKEV